jgi:hypothetical protein
MVYPTEPGVQMDFNGYDEPIEVDDEWGERSERVNNFLYTYFTWSAIASPRLRLVYSGTVTSSACPSSFSGT